MHVALVSTFPPTRCGIAGYSSHLVQACREDGIQVTVLAERVDPGKLEETETLRCWSRAGSWHDEVLAQLQSVRPDVVHIQHEEAILGQDSRLPKLLAGLRRLGIASVVTLHSVYDGYLGVPGIRWTPVRFQRALGELADVLVVHQDYGCRDRLLAQGVAEDTIAVIPHGTLAMTLPDRDACREKLGIAASARIVLAIGFIHKKKGVHTLVHCFPEVAAQVMDARLVVAGSFRSRLWDLPYRKRLSAQLRRGAAAGWIAWHEGFHSAEDMNVFLAAADVLALPYRQSYGSASGVLHLALAAGKPVICASGYKFAEAQSAWGAQFPELFPAPTDDKAWSRAIVKLLGDDGLREEIRQRAKALGEATSWSAVGKRHAEVYRQARQRLHRAA